MMMRPAGGGGGGVAGLALIAWRSETASPPFTSR